MAITTGGDDPSSSTSISLQHQHNKATAAASGQGRAAVGGPAALGHPRGTEGSGDRARRFLRGEAGKGLSDLVLGVSGLIYMYSRVCARARVIIIVE